MSGYCTVKLSGRLARMFGRDHKFFLDTGSVNEAFSALRNALPGFKSEIERANKLGMRYAIFRNRTNEGKDAFSLDGSREIRIIPVLEGSKRGGILQTIIGVVMIGAGVFFGQPWLVQAGIGVAIGGVIQMLSPQAKGLSVTEDSANRPSYAFGGPVNTVAMGNPVGILAGRRQIGGAIISAGIYAEDLA